MTHKLLHINIRQPSLLYCRGGGFREPDPQQPWHAVRDLNGRLRGLRNLSGKPLYAVRFVLWQGLPSSVSLPVRVEPAETVSLRIDSGSLYSGSSRIFVQWREEGGAEMLYSLPFI